MTAKHPNRRTTEHKAPFGAQSPGSRGPLVFWAILYFGWFLLLFWMAAFRAGD